MRRIDLAAAILGLMLGAAGGLSACAQTGATPGELVWPPDPHPDFALSPRVTGEGSEGVNRQLAVLDARAQAGRTDCVTQGGHDGEWTRVVWAPFEGPRFLTVAVNDAFYCGGAHPSVSLIRLTFDRSTGGAPDWAILWPDAQLLAVSEAGEVLPSTTLWPELVDWFRTAVRNDPENDADWLEECDAYYGERALQEPLVVWLDAAGGGIAMDWAHLPHVAMACGSPQVMPVDVAARLGASPALLDAVRQGHAERSFEDLP